MKLDKYYPLILLAYPVFCIAACTQVCADKSEFASFVITGLQFVTWPFDNFAPVNIVPVEA